MLLDLTEHGQQLFETWYPGLETSWVIQDAAAV
jgi:hypothetical protein